MRTLIVVALCLVAAGCGGTTNAGASAPRSNPAADVARAGMLSPFWRKHHSDGWINDTMRAVCTDLRKNGSTPPQEALALTQMKDVSVTDAESLVSAGIVTNCPSVKIPKAWSQSG